MKCIPQGSIRVGAPLRLCTQEFYQDEQRIVDVYYKEICEVVKSATGRRHARFRV